jgi:hypothetical protein
VTAIPTVWIAQELRNGPERIAIVGDGDKAPLLFLAPLLEEANRTRHFLIETMRDLARRGHRCALPDLPGTLESEATLADVSWQDWLDAARGAAEAIGASNVVSLRGGALLDGAVSANAHYRFAPVKGAALVRDLVRVRMAADRENGVTATAAEVEAAALAGPFEVAGYRLGDGFMAAVKAAIFSKVALMRIARLETDAQPADVKIAGQPLWRRAEPEHDEAFSQRLADDISDWLSACAAG